MSAEHTSNRFIILALAVGGFAIGTTEFAAMSLVPEFSQDLGLSKPQAGHVISAYALGVVLGAPILAVLGARFTSRRLLTAFMAVFAAGNVLSALADSYITLLLSRFLAGFPHGAFFGVAALLAASLVPRHKRSQAFAMVLLGLTIATVVGVPLAATIGKWVSWRWVFAFVALLASITATCVWLLAPSNHRTGGSNILAELSALKRVQVWLSLLIGAVGFGGLFAVYTYLASTLIEVTQAQPIAIPIVFACFGIGMTAGNLLAARAGDIALLPTMAGTIVICIISLAIYPLTTGNVWALSAIVILIGAGGGLSTVLQTRLMDVAGEAQTLAAALNHAALNFANALGPWLAGWAIAFGAPLPMTGWVGCALAVCGLLLFFVSVQLEKSHPNTAAALPL
ncbi:MFS transporter [Halioxenophilus aromaticivorans]|uniref:MFS transporter n=1 Tax=Halioxenophilus aromaticivorans TaxID=1306992 RepID=A0AAV3U4G2_9ALTE